MVKRETSEIDISESIPDLWQLLTPEQRELLNKNYTIQKFKKNETIYSVNFNKVCTACGLSESRMKHLICEPEKMKFETVAKIFRLYRFSSEQILECFR